MIKSPCKNVCELDLNTGLCLGCNRSIEEITNWSLKNNKEKIKIIKKSQNIDLLRRKNHQKMSF